VQIVKLSALKGTDSDMMMDWLSDLESLCQQLALSPWASRARVQVVRRHHQHGHHHRIIPLSESSLPQADAMLHSGTVTVSVKGIPNRERFRIRAVAGGLGGNPKTMG
jgi:hypothetical protein